MAEEKKQYDWVCNECGTTARENTIKAGGKIYACTGTSTYHSGECEVCGNYTEVTQPRDFGYPDFSGTPRKAKAKETPKPTPKPVINDKDGFREFDQFEAAAVADFQERTGFTNMLVVGFRSDGEFGFMCAGDMDLFTQLGALEMAKEAVKESAFSTEDKE